MKNNIWVICLAAVLCAGIFSFRPQPAVPVEYDYMTVSAVESLVAGGMGRSRMITTTAAGKQEEIEMKNFFSLGGINFENLRMNDLSMTKKLQEMTAAGWELAHVTNGTASAGDNGQGIYLTRYLFRKAK